MDTTGMLPYTTDHMYHGVTSDGVPMLVNYAAVDAMVASLQGAPGYLTPRDAWLKALDPDTYLDSAPVPGHDGDTWIEDHRHDLDYSYDGQTFAYHAAVQAAKSRWSL